MAKLSLVVDVENLQSVDALTVGFEGVQKELASMVAGQGAANEELIKSAELSKKAGDAAINLAGDIGKIALSADPVKAAMQALNQHASTFAEQALKGEAAAKLLGKGWVEAAGSASVAAGAGAAVGAAIGGTVIKVAELTAALIELRSERNLGAVAAARANQETERTTEIFRRTAAAAGMTEAELRKVVPTMADLMAEAKKDPGGEIARGLAAVSTAAVDAKREIADIQTSLAGMAETRTAAKEQDAWQKWLLVVEETRLRMGATAYTAEELAAGLGQVAAEGTKAANEIAKIVLGPGLAKSVYEARDAANAASDAMIKAAGDAMMLGDNVTAGAARGVAGIEALGVTLAALKEGLSFSFPQASDKIAGIDAGSTAKVGEDLAKITDKVSPLNKGTLDAAREAVAGGDIGALRELIDILKNQQKLEEKYGGTSRSGADKLAFSLEQAMRELLASIGKQPAAIRDALAGTSVTMDGAKVGAVVVDNINRGKVPGFSFA